MPVLVYLWSKIILERRSSMSDVLQVTDDTFEKEILKSEIPAVVDFWAEWCGPCKMVGPVVEELAKEYEGKIKVASMDVDGNRKTPGAYGIRNIPTLIFFKNGQVEQTVIGAHPKSVLDEHVRKML
jgi:thioredoxin 1